MNEKPFAEQDLLEDLDAESAHADELATPLPQVFAVSVCRVSGAINSLSNKTFVFAENGTDFLSGLV